MIENSKFVHHVENEDERCGCHSERSSYTNNFSMLKLNYRALEMKISKISFSIFSDILKDADLTDMSSKKVRNQIEQKLDCDLLSRKKEIDDLVMDFVNSKANSDDDDSDESTEETSTKAAKRPAAAKNSTPAKKKKVAASDDDDAKDDDDFDDNNTSSRRQSSRGGKKETKKSTKKPRVKKVTFDDALHLIFLLNFITNISFYRMVKNVKAADTHDH